MKAYILGYADVYGNRTICNVTSDEGKVSDWVKLNVYARIAGGVSQTNKYGGPKVRDVSYSPRIREYAERKLAEAGIGIPAQAWEWPHWVEEFEVS